MHNSMHLLLCLSLALGFSASRAGAAWSQMTGFRDFYYRCTDPIPLTNAGTNLTSKSFENSFPWKGIAESYQPSPLLVHTAIGRAMDPEQGGWLVDRKTRGEEFRIELEAETVHSFKANALNRLIERGEKLELDKAEMAFLQISRQLEVFSGDGLKAKDARQLSLNRLWRSYAKGLRVFANYRQSYAVIIPPRLDSVSVCVAFPPAVVARTMADGDRRMFERERGATLQCNLKGRSILAGVGHSDRVTTHALFCRGPCVVFGNADHRIASIAPQARFSQMVGWAKYKTRAVSNRDRAVLRLRDG